MNQEQQPMLALVTGASSGIGLQYATQLARDYHCDLLLVSNQQKELDEVAADLAAKYGVKTTAHFADLSLTDAAENLYAWCQEQKLEVDILINNAGVFFFNKYCDTPLKRIELMLQLHVMTVAKMTRLFAADMCARRRGYILNMSSMSAWMAMPGIQTYNASKAFIYNFSKSLWYELKPYNVHITVMAPGAVDTGLYSIKPVFTKIGKCLGIIVSPQTLVRRALRALFRGRAKTTIPTVFWRVLCFLILLAPTCLLRLIRRLGWF